MKINVHFAALLLLAMLRSVVPGEERPVQSEPADRKGEVLQFNRDYEAAHQRMDTPAILATWADDGVSLLPDTAPIIGKPAIEQFVNNAMKNLVGFKMLKAEIRFHDIQVSRDWASEWGVEHQLLQPPDGKPVIDHYGKILLILHRTPAGWKVQQEMWNSTPKPQS